jgi:low affinity Fe/Cu permease
MRSIFIVVLLLTVFWQNINATEITTIQLQHRLSEEVVSLVRPLLQPNERIVANSNGLILMAKPQRITEIRSLIEQLDRRSKQFVISVVQSEQLTAEELNAQVDIEAHVPLDKLDNWQGRISGSLNRSHDDHSIRVRQKLKVLEGHSGIIEVGEEHPVSVTERDGYYSSTRRFNYKKATTGFQVIPRMLGNCRIRLQISPWSIRVTSREYGGHTVQSAETTLEVKLGEWFELGAHHQKQDQQRTELLRNQSRRQVQDAQIFLKIDSTDGC